MKILKFTKLRNGMYKLKLENESEIKVHEELILKKDLLITKDISLDDVNEELHKRSKKTGNLKPERKKIEIY